MIAYVVRFDRRYMVINETDLDLGPPVPAGARGDELSPPGTVAGNTSDFIMSATATDTHCSHVFHERVPPRPLWLAPSSASSLWRMQNRMEDA